MPSISPTQQSKADLTEQHIEIEMAPQPQPVSRQEPPKTEAAVHKPRSSSSSEFMFNPDPNFLAKINENMRNNDVVNTIQT